jgi:hypothetical protein
MYRSLYDHDFFMARPVAPVEIRKTTSTD